MLGITISRSSKLAKAFSHNQQIENDYNFLLKNHVVEKAVGERQFYTGRPPMNYPALEVESGARMPQLPFPREYCFYLTRLVDSIRLPIDVINREVIRNGFEIKSRYEYLCDKCGKEFKTKPTKSGYTDPEKAMEAVDDPKKDLQCDVCGNEKLKMPDPANRKKLKKWLDGPWNFNGQRIQSFIANLERDIDTVDDFYVIVRKKYDVDKEGNIIKEDITEVLTVDPPNAFVVCDHFGNFGMDSLGNRVYICLKHRDKIIKLQKGQKELNGVKLKFNENEEPHCPEPNCNVICKRVRLELNSTFDSYGPVNNKPVYVAENECIHTTGKYMRGKIYGYSPIYTLELKIRAMYGMDTYVKSYFDKQRPPRGLLILGTRNYEGAKKAFDNIKEQQSKDPYGLTAMIVDSEKTGRNMAQFLNLTGSLEDLQFIQMRDEFRRTIGALYGILGLFSGDLEAGWSQEGLEMTVTNRKVQDDQSFMVEEFLKVFAVRMLNISDWYIDIKINEEMDRLRKLQIKTQEGQYAQILSQLGYQHHFDGNGDMVFSTYPQQPTMDTQLGSNALSGEQMTNAQGMPKGNRPSDTGGVADGHPASGDKTSMSDKARDRIRGLGL